ncbi:GAF domain-containing protein [Dokdonella sp.]|uniref:GAF domain-containing protein n=1 Tax=Dokdonella sp. TaxID=2291710 RepID=UPI003C684BFC
MKTRPSSTSNPLRPKAVGFDLPPARKGSTEPSTGHAMVTLLDGVPAREWSAMFARHAAAFKLDHSLVDLRLVGHNISAIGEPDVLRGLSNPMQAFIHRISRQCMQERTLGHVGQENDEAKAGNNTPTGTAERPELDPLVQRDLAAIGKIAGIPTILEAVTRVTGMRFAAVARVTDTRWTACAVYDLIEFGLLPGQDLVLESTICNEIRQHGNIVTFDHASASPVFCKHPTPAMYGFESYISLPITRDDGSFFGTLCALDPAPSRLDEISIRTLEMFARAIGRELEAEPKAA